MNEEQKKEAFVQAMHGKKHGGRIEKWSEFSNNDRTSTVIHGHLFDDPQERFEEGGWLRTSSVVELNEEAGYVVTKYTFYTLGEKFERVNEV